MFGIVRLTHEFGTPIFLNACFIQEFWRDSRMTYTIVKTAVPSSLGEIHVQEPPGTIIDRIEEAMEPLIRPPPKEAK
jgi:hypothetical protein